MPTIHIRSSPLGLPRRRAVAVRLTRWLRQRGVAPQRVVVHFSDHAPNSVYSGGMPVEAVGDPAAVLRYASVVCLVGADRDAEFRTGLADELATALGAGPGTGFLYVEFRPTRQDHVHIWLDNSMSRADGISPGQRQRSEDDGRDIAYP